MSDIIKIKVGSEEREHEIVPIGSTFQYEGYKYHVVNSFLDEGTGYYIYVIRYYGKHKQWWHYEVWDAFEYDMRIRKLY